MTECKGVISPGSVEEKENVDKPEHLVEFNPKDSTFYRRSAARLTYMALDRPDLSFATKVVASGMSKPSVGDVIRLKRVLRYLMAVRNVKLCYAWQDPVEQITGWADSDWAGDRKTRKTRQVEQL